MNASDSVISRELRTRISGIRQTAEGEYVCVIHFDPAFRGFEGHFEGNPIVPGVCLIEAARVFAEEVLMMRLQTRFSRQCRFRRPIFAGENADVKLKLAADAPGTWDIQTEIRVGDAVSAQLRLRSTEL
jgi:3-hydroxymyristoyl/3-hydroxydecanoyl-(acyl carrier protein) dehydratase